MNMFELSDGIKALKGRFAMHEMVVLDEGGIGFVCAELERLRQLALTLEAEKSGGVWSASARRSWVNEAHLINAVFDEAKRPGTNLTLFPERQRPAFDDGHPKGAA